MEKRLEYIDKTILYSLMAFAVFSFFSISLTQISCGIGGLAWMYKCQLTGAWKEQNLPLKLPFLLFVAACIAAVAGSVDIESSYKSLKRLLEILIFFWAVNCIESEEQRERLILLLIASASLSTLTGFYSAWKTGITILARVEGTMSVYMTYAGLLMLALLVVLGKLLFEKSKWRYWLWGGVALMTACLLLTYTRQAWLGVMAGLVFLIWNRKKVLLWFLPVFMALLFVVSPDHVKNRMRSLVDLQDGNLAARIALWKGGWLVFKDHPVIGCGFKCIDAVNHKYPDPTGYIKKLRGLHNNFVQLAVDTGILGLGSWISVWVLYFLTLYRRRLLMEGNPRLYGCMMGSSAAVFGFLIAGVFETNFYDAEVSMALYFIMALPFTCSQKPANMRA